MPNPPGTDVQLDAELRRRLDVMMTALDQIATATEGTPKPPYLRIHGLAGQALREGNAILRFLDARWSYPPAQGSGDG